MQNMTKEKQLEADATASQGSAEQKYQTYLQSTTAKINTLTVSLHTMFSEMVNSSQINNAVGGLQTMLNAVISLTKQFGVLPVAMTAIIPILSQIDSKFAMLKIGFNDGNIQFTGLLANGFKNLKTSLDNYSDSYAKYIQQLVIAKGEEASAPGLLTRISASMLAVGNSAAGAAIKTATLTAANIALNAAIGFGIGAAISGIIALFTSWSNKIKDTQTDIDSLSSKMDSLKQNDQLIKQYQDLSTQLQNTSKDSTDYKNIQSQILDIQKQFGQSFKSLVDGYDAEGNALVKNIDKLKEYNNQQKLMIQAQASKDYSTMYDKITKKGNYLVGNSSWGISIGNDQTSEIDKYTKYVKLLDDEMKTTGVDTQGYADKLKDASSHIQSFNENAVKLYSIGQTNVQYFDTATGKMVKYSDYLKQNQQDTQGATNATNANSNALNVNGQASNSSQNAIKSLSDVMTDLSDGMSKAQTNLTDINQLLDKHKTSGEWDYATILKLANNGYPSLISAMGDDKKMTDILIQAKQDEVNNAEDSLKKQIDLEKNKVNSVLVAYGLDVSNFDSAEQAKTKILQAEVNKRLALLQNEAKAYSDNANAQLDKANKDGDEVASQKAAQLYQKDLNRVKSIQSQIDGLKSGDLSNADPSLNDDVNNYFNLKKLQESATKALDGVGSTSDDGKTNSSNPANKQANAALTAQSREIANESRNLTNESQALDAQSKALNAEKSTVLKDIDNQYKAEQQHIDDIITGYNKELDALKEKKQLQDDTNSAIDYQNKLIKDQQDLNNAINQKTVMMTDASGKITYSADQSKVDSAREALAKDQEDYRRWQADQAIQSQEDAISKQIQVQQDAKDAQTTAYNNKKDAIDASYQAKLDAISNQKDTISSKQNALDEQKNDINDKRNALQGFAGGSEYVPKTSQYIVGEKGREIVTLPQGAKVTPNNETEKILSGKSQAKIAKDTLNDIGDAVNNNKNLVKKPIDELVNEIGNHLQQFVDGSGQYGKNSNKNIGSGITNSFDNVYNPTRTLVGNVKGLITAFVNSTNSDGKNVGVQLGQGVTDSQDDLNKNVEALCTKMIDTFHEKLGIHSPSTVMHEIGGFLIQGLINGMNEADIEKFITDKIGGMTGVINGQVVAVPGTVSDWLSQAMKITGVDSSWLPALEMIASRESGNPGTLGTGDPTLKNNIGVGGEYATGLMQTLPSTFKEYMMAGHDNILNPIDNAISAIRYIQDRYKTPYAIKNWSNSNYIGYQTGTDSALPGIANVAENGMELVINKQLRNFQGGEVVIPHNQTMNMLQSLMPRFEIPDLSKMIIPKGDNITKHETNINVANVEMPSGIDAEGFVDKLRSLSNVTY